MKLMVGELLELLNGVQKILQHYQGSKVVDMLDDIYQRCCTSEDLGKSYQWSPDRIRDNGGSPKVKAPKDDKKKKRELRGEEDVWLLQEELRSLNRAEAELLLNLYTIKDLLKFADSISVSVKKGNKDVVVGQICNHFGFRHLNDKMEQRPNMAR